MIDETTVRVPPRWYTLQEIEHCLQRMSYSEQVIAELAPWFFRHIQAAFNKGYEKGSNTRDQASSPEGEAIPPLCYVAASTVEAFGTISDAGSVGFTAFKSPEREFSIPLFTRSNAKAGEVEGQMLPKGWNIEVRTANGKHALCVFGPDGCFAVHGDTDHKSDIRAEVIDQLRIALSTHDKTKA